MTKIDRDKLKVLMEVSTKNGKHYKLVATPSYQERVHGISRGKLVTKWSRPKRQYFMLWGNEDDVQTMGASALSAPSSRVNQSTATKMFMKAIKDTVDMSFKKTQGKQ